MKAPGVLGVAGHTAEQKRIFDYLRSRRIHPSLLLTGPDADLKFRIAKNMAKALLCERPGTRAFCATCSICRRIDKEIHPDVLFVKEEDEDSIKIEKVRAICHQMEISPLETPAKICIVQECHRLSVSSANAFLKTLEEPGPGRHFWLLTTQSGSLLPTVVSRCLQFTFAPEEQSDFADDEKDRQLEELLREALQSRDPRQLTAKLEDKESCLRFLRLLQTRLHAIATNQSPSEFFRDMDCLVALNRFEAALELEGRLRSNANCGLLLEDFLRRELLS